MFKEHLGKLRKALAITLSGALLVGVGACGTNSGSSNENQKNVNIGVVGDSNEVWDPIIKNLKKDGINIELVKFSDYVQPNEALAKGDIDLNAFQGYILMNNFNKTHHNALASVGETVLNPIGLYSDKAKKPKDIPNNSEVTIANDEVNAARGLLLLQSAGLIKLKYKEGTNPTPDDIVSNPKNLKITELEASQTARSLPDVGASVINVFMALDAGFTPKTDAIYNEPVNKDSKPYYNIIVARAKDKNNPTYKKIVKAYRSDESKKIIDKLYKGSVIPLW